MPALQVRNCPADIYEGLCGIAQESGCSLTRATILVLREGLEMRNDDCQKAARIQKRQDAFASFDAMGKMRPGNSTLDPVEVIHAARSERMQVLDDAVPSTIVHRSA